jgi:hypothetical protein
VDEQFGAVILRDAARQECMTVCPPRTTGRHDWVVHATPRFCSPKICSGLGTQRVLRPTRIGAHPAERGSRRLLGLGIAVVELADTAGRPQGHRPERTEHALGVRSQQTPEVTTPCGNRHSSDSNERVVSESPLLSAPDFNRAAPSVQRSRGNRYVGLLSNALPKTCLSASRISQAMTEVGVIWIVTSSHDANTGPTRGSASAASLRYLA